MPHKSLREIRAYLCRELLSTDRLIDALLVVEHPEGREIFRAGGLWDRTARRYSDERPAVPRIVRLKRSQVEPDPVTGLSIADGIARWLDKMRRGIDEGRPIVIMAEGNRGSGKTWLLGSLLAVVVALEFPRGAQFSVNLTGKQKREVMQAIERIAAPAWIGREVKDQRDPYLPFLTDHALYWRTGRAPAALREGGITFHYGFVNEAQDQHPDVGLNAVGAIRNLGTLVGIATNPDPDGGWVADVKEGIEAGSDHDGEVYRLEAALNDAINQATQPKIARVLRWIDRDAADADAFGLWRRRGAAYPAFSTRPRRTDESGRYLDGHVGQPPIVDVGRPLWRDVTLEETAALLGPGATGFPWIGGSDFQRSPGCCIAPGKLFRDEHDTLILYVRQFIGAAGDEHDLTQALVNAGYYPGDTDMDGRPAPGRGLLIIGDGTGDQQDSTHRRGNPYSFKQLIGDGWKVIPPMRHYRTGKCHNPDVLDSRKQMHTALSAGWILFDPACAEPAADFPSLVDGLKKSQVNSSGKFVKRGHFTHGPDGVRYMAWRFLPRNRPAPVDTTPDRGVFELLKKKRPTEIGI